MTTKFSENRQFALAQQMQRAAISIPSNIAEGFNRNSRKEYAQFLGIVLGSTGELETQCALSVMAGFAASKDFSFIVSELDEIGKMLRAMIRTLKTPSPSD